jgi:Protein kinase domain
VFAAVDEVLGREVAVKTLRGKHSGLAARLLDERFRQEARAIAALAHPGVVQVFDIDLAAEPPYIVMERVVGPSLKDRLRERRLDPVEIRALGIQIGRALAAAHAAGIVHRDVKPANILAATGDTWKLADFGVAHVPDSAITMTGQFVGSPAYAPPEALVRGQTGPAGDVYGLGATLYEAAAGRWPRMDGTSGALLAPIAPLAELAPGLPPELAAAIDRAVLQEPEARPSASELADALAGAASHPGLAAVSFAGSPATVHGVAPGPWMIGGRAIRARHIAIAVGIVLLIGTIAAIATRGSTPMAAISDPGAPNTASSRPPPTEPGELGIATPVKATRDRRAAKDWRKVLDKLRKGEIRDAQEKLDEFEHRWGEAEEIKLLREQLATLPEDRERHDD